MLRRFQQLKQDAVTSSDDRTICPHLLITVKIIYLKVNLYIKSNLDFKRILRVYPISKDKHLIVVQQKVLHSLEDTHMRLLTIQKPIFTQCQCLMGTSIPNRTTDLICGAWFLR